jgi:DNA-binding transcriptional LysR family regulator
VTSGSAGGGDELRLVEQAQPSAPDAIADLAARGLGAAVLSVSMAAAHRDRLTVRAIDDVETPALLALVWRRAHNPAVRALLRHSRQSFAGSDAGTGRTEDPSRQLKVDEEAPST